MKKLVFVLALVLGLGSQAQAANHFNKVLIIVFENTDFGDAVKQPYFSSLVKEGALLTNYHALTHPSQGNYVAMIAGSLLGVKDDKPVNLDQRHIGDLLEEAGKSWKLYAEDYPGNCFLGRSSGNYVRKHVPFLSFTNVQNNPTRCAKVVHSDEFQKDFMGGNLPAYSMYVPDLKNDGHDTGVAFGDKWLKAHFDKTLHSSKFPDDLLVVITFDESSHNLDNKIYMLMLGPSVKVGSTSDIRYDHYSLLKTIEDNLGLGSLKQNDMNAILLENIWK